MSFTTENLEAQIDSFSRRHIGPGEQEVAEMLEALGFASGQAGLDALADAVVPSKIRMKGVLELPAARGEYEMLAEIRAMASGNQVFRSLIGMGYSDCVTPPVIQRGILENPGWYTQYTPYQAEIAQGRLEALLNFQTMIVDLTALPVANASLLDEGTAAAEAMAMAFGIRGRPAGGVFFISELCHPQSIAVMQTRAEPLGIRVVVGDFRTFSPDPAVFGAILQYPATDGAIHDYRPFIQALHEKGGVAILAADLLSLALLTPPGELGADIAVGSSQRFGVPMGFGGPSAAFSPAATSISASFRVASSECRSTAMATRRFA